MPQWEDEDDDEGEARLFRRDARDEAAWEQTCDRAIVHLLAHLAPDMARWELFTFQQQRRWGLRRH